jgi:parallel beta-helix repeat protein
MMKPLLVLVVLLLCVRYSNATSYYFSSVSGDDTRTSTQATSPLTPWKTLSKFNAIAATLKPGDSVFFKRGEVFFGSMAPTISGAAGAIIYYGAYGIGANPLISGLTTVSGWTAYGNGIYYASLTAPNLQMVTINGIAKGRGRWPNTGYLQVDSHVGNQSITSSGLAGAPTTNWTGGEIVIRKYRFILDRHTITSQSGNTLNYNTSTQNGWNSGYAPVDKNGFFIQGHLATLDQFGEWHYDATNKRLYVHFGGDVPTNYAVKASTQDYNISLTNITYSTFDNLDFEGGNTKGINMSYCSNINIANCNFNNEGGFAISGKNVYYVTVRGGSVSNSFSNGINFDEYIGNCTVDGVTVTNTNMIAGTGRSGSGVGNGITVNGDNTIITNNRVINCGYSGIQFFGNNVLVEKNYVDGFCYLKDDGGGIYTFNGPNNNPEYNRIVRNNIILNAIGNFESAKTYWWESYGKAAGIYMDEYVNNVQLINNTIANGDWAGIFIHNTHDCQITGNIIYNHRYQIHLSQYSLSSRNMIETNNQYIAKQPFQMTWFYRTYISDSPTNMGTSDNNYFARPINDNKTIRLGFLMNSGGDTTDVSLAQWQSQYGLDLNSHKSPITYTANIDDSIRFEYNASNTIKTIALDAAYIDVAGNQYAGVLTLNPWTSVVLLKAKTGTVIKQNQIITFPSIANKTYGDPAFILNATASSGLPVSYRVISGPATISGNTVTLMGTGTVTIEASQTGNATYNAATPVQQSFTVQAPPTTTKQSQTITFPPLANKTYGDAPFALNATASSGLPVNYRVIAGLATVSGNMVTITGTGEVWIEASQPGNSTYNPAQAISQSFVVTKVDQTITFPPIPNKTFGDAPFSLNATASSGLPVSYKVSSGPATVSGNIVTITGTGTVWIEASQSGDANYNWAPLTSQGFTVVAASTTTKSNQTITFPPLANKTYGDAPFTLMATASSGLPVSYRIASGPATMSGNTVTITGAGIVTVEASQAGNSTYNAATPVQQSFTVNKALQTITFGPLVNKTYGDPAFAMIATASSGLPVLYRVVSGPATISGNVVTLTGVGTVTIEALQPGDNNYNAATSVQQSFVVYSGTTTTKQNQTITFGTLPYKTYTSPPFDLTATASSGLPVSYRVVSGPITISGSTVTVTGVGSAIIEASQAGNSIYNAATPVQRSFTIGKAGQSITFPAIPNKTYGDAPFALNATASSGLPVSYRVVSGPAIVSGNIVTLTGSGTVTIEASQAGNAFYSAAYSPQRSFTVASLITYSEPAQKPAMAEKLSAMMGELFAGDRSCFVY